MPKIPTILSDATLRGGAVSPEADPLAFNAAAGLDQLGGAIANTGDIASRIHAKKVSDDEDRWLVNASHTYNLEAANFENDPNNKSREDFAQITFDQLESRKKEFLAKAPSQRAATRLQAQLDNVIESRYHRAQQVGEVTKLTNAQLEIDTSINNSMTAYRADAANSPQYAAKNLEPQMDLLKDSIMTRWGKIAPNHASKLLEHIEKQFVVGTAEHDSAYARKLLDESNFIDESGRAQLLNYIEGQEKSANRLVREDFANGLTETLKYAKRTNGMVADVPLASFEAVLGKDDGKLAKARFDRDAKEINQASAFTGKVAGKNVNSLIGEFSNFVENKTISDAAKSDAAVTVKEMARQSHTDSWGYVTQHNPEVAKAYEFAAQAGTPDAFSRANKIALEYQGYAPAVAMNQLHAFETTLSDAEEAQFQTWKAKYAPNDSGYDYDLRGAFKAGITPGANGHWPDTYKKPNHPTFSDESKYASVVGKKFSGHWDGENFTPPEQQWSDEASKYQNLPTNARHLMSQSKAIAQAMQWRGPATEQSVKALNDFVMTYPEDQRAVAFNDLINLPPSDQKVSKTLEWAFLHRHKPFVKNFMDAQNNVEALKNLTAEKRSDYEKALFSDPSWMPFADTLLQGSVTRATEVSDYKEGLINYAYSMKGKSPKDAVLDASKQLIGSEFSFPKVNGVAVMVARKRPDETYRSDDEVAELPRQLNIAIQSVPVDQVKLTTPDGRQHWPMFEKIVGDKPLKDLLPDLIKRHGFFVPTPNGQGATVYLRTDDGVVGQLLDKNNQPWEVDFDALPDVERIQPPATSKFTWPPPYDAIRGRIWKNYPRDDYRVGPGMQPPP